MTKGVLHVAVGSEEWTPSESELEEVVQLFINADKDPTGIVVTRHDIKTNFIPSYRSVEVHPYDALLASTMFNSTDDKRLESNTFPDSLEPDNVSYNYRTLSDEEKQDMREVKILAQNLINKISSIKTKTRTDENSEEEYCYNNESALMLDEAIKNAMLASMWATKCITGPKN